MKKRIVIAEDDPITRLDLIEMLLQNNYNVVGEAKDGFDVIELCRKFKPDLVLMDIKMPLLDGINAAQIIRNERLAKAIILLTAYSSKNFIDKAKKVGVRGYLVKPIDEKSLLTTLEIALSNANELEEVTKKLESTNEKLDARKKIEKAKGILMNKYSINEQEAYVKLRKLSMDKRTSMKEISEIIILSYNESDLCI
ncbi:ANTAR domain-containing response regulator [Crassaminicella indica]|uniref:Response regulator n=1 Tax=Crassaminicella indica TaxID=2855394 RepID=A0ABX8RBU2_9CLOT|nr:response regulator [Crassaminicella indica]QXM06525.1 response regulator [Crassaminicella indica]